MIGMGASLPDGTSRASSTRLRKPRRTSRLRGTPPTHSAGSGKRSLGNRGLSRRKSGAGKMGWWAGVQTRPEVTLIKSMTCSEWSPLRSPSTNPNAPWSTNHGENAETKKRGVRGEACPQSHAKREVQTGYNTPRTNQPNPDRSYAVGGAGAKTAHHFSPSGAWEAQEKQQMVKAIPDP
jgi:hypothetical protein